MRPGHAPRFGEASLTDCDREPIHIPGSIQPHGCLLAVDPTSGEIRQAAGDTRAIIGCDEPLGRRLDVVIGEEGAARILDNLPLLRDRRVPQSLYEVAIAAPAGPLDALLHLSDETLVVELEPARQPRRDVGDLLMKVQQMLANLARAKGLDAYLQACAEEVRGLTGFDRVMVYRFLEDGSGKVAAEAKAPEMESFLDLHYPESDIPKQARALYLKSWTRAIPDADYVPAPLVPEVSPATGAPLDLSFSSLRSVSPLHVRYMKNMGVAASMSISIVHRGTLFGLIACHHRTPHFVPCDVRAACEVFGQVFSLEIESRLHAETYEYSLQQKQVQQHLVSRLSQEPSLSDGLVRFRPNLLDLIQGDGVAVFVDGGFTEIGHTPGQAGVQRLVKLLNDHGEEGIFATDRLSELVGEEVGTMNGLAGILALSVSRTPKDWIFWFRREVVETVTWAGNPDKAIGRDGSNTLTPRASFKAWHQTVRGRCRPWRDIEVEAAGSLRISILEVVLRRLDEVARERSEAQERQRLLVAELDHRVKNTLANIQALMRHTRRSHETLEGYIESLELRIKAMAHAQTLLSESRWRGAELRRIVEGELSRFPDASIVVEGPQVELDSRATLAVSMLTHELATNAAKYGALSVSGGSVAVRWTLGKDAFRMEWREGGGPLVSAPQRRGFGRVLIESGIVYELEGTSELRFEPGGVSCSLTIPNRHVLAAPTENGATEASGGGGARRVLLVEDSLITALDVAESLTTFGYEVLGPVGRVADALVAIERDKPELAVLDINLGEEDSFPIADRLAREHVPFIFLTGYDATSILPQRFKDTPCIGKPFSDRLLETSLTTLLSSREA